MQTPHRKPLRPVNRITITPSSAPHSTSSNSTSKPTRPAKPSRIPSFTPHQSRTQPRALSDPEQENLSNVREAGSAAAVVGGVAGVRRVRRQVMRLSELMAAVRMTPIKEREEEYGLGEAEVAIDCCSGDRSARKRTVAQQEEEIRQYEAMLRTDEADEKRRLHTAGESDGDDFHTASEFELELSELQQVSVEDDDRRSSLFAAPLLPVVADWTDDMYGGRVVEQAACTGVEANSVQPTRPCDTNEALDDSEIELQQPIKLATNSNQHGEPLTTSLFALSERETDSHTAALPVSATLSADEQCLTSEQPDEGALCSVQRHTESVSTDELDVMNEKVSVPCRIVSVCDSSTLPFFVSSSPAALPSPCPSCTSCSSLFVSLQQYHFDCDQLHTRVAQLTLDSESIQSVREKYELELQRTVDEREAAELEMGARLEREDEDYKSLYFAYCQLERDYHALKAKQPSEVPTSVEVQDVDEEEVDVDVSEDKEVVDYAAMSEEKVVPARSPEPALVAELSAELQQLRLDKAEAEALVESRLAAAETEAAEANSKYGQLQIEYSLQLQHLASLLTTVEDTKLAQAHLEATHELVLSERDGQIQLLHERVISLDAQHEQLETELHSRQQQLETLHTQLQHVDAEKMQLTSELASRQLEV